MRAWGVNGCLMLPIRTVSDLQRLALQVYTSSRPLRVGYYETDNYTMPTPAMRRAVLETKKRLEAAGHTVQPREPVGLALWWVCSQDEN